MRVAPPPSSPPPWSMRRVIQKHEYGCGIACVAMLAGLTYWDVCHDIFGDYQGDATSLDDLCIALRDYGLTIGKRAIPFWEAGYLHTQLRQPALLIMNPDRFGNWHAAVWDAERRRILDPMKRPDKHPIVVGHLAIKRAGLIDDHHSIESDRISAWP